MTTRRFAWLVPLLSVAVSPALAQQPIPDVNDGQALQRECRSAIDAADNGPATNKGSGTGPDALLERGSDMGQCLGLVSGVWHTHLMMVDVLRSPGAFCPPRSITTGQMARIVDAYLAEHPADLQLWDTELILRAFVDAYPCQFPNVNDGQALQQECRSVINAADNGPGIDSGSGAGPDDLERGSDMGQCLGLVSGVWHTHMIMVHELGSPEAFCPTESITAGQMARIVDAYLAEHPADLQLLDTVLILRAFVDAYPCQFPSVNDGQALQQECRSAIDAADNGPATNNGSDSGPDDLLEQGSDRGQCLGLVSGVWHTHVIMVDEFGSSEAFCPTQSISAGQMARIVDAYLAEHPADLQLPDTVLILRAFVDEYPCR